MCKWIWKWCYLCNTAYCLRPNTRSLCLNFLSAARACSYPNIFYLVTQSPLTRVWARRQLSSIWCESGLMKPGMAPSHRQSSGCQRMGPHACLEEQPLLVDTCEWKSDFLSLSFSTGKKGCLWHPIWERAWGIWELYIKCELGLY